MMDWCVSLTRENRDMKMVRIKFADPKKEAQGFVALAKQARVVCFADGTYSIGRSHLKILDKLGIAYKVVTEEGFDHVSRSLRNPVAA